MFRSLTALVAVPLLLIGCAGQAPQPQHVYSDAELKAFGLKMLSGSKMDSALYARYRRALSEDRDAARDSGS